MSRWKLWGVGVVLYFTKIVGIIPSGTLRKWIYRYILQLKVRKLRSMEESNSDLRGKFLSVKAL